MSVALRQRTGRNTEVPDGLSVSLHLLTRRPTMADKDLKALFLHQLKDTYFAETAILKALPQMADAAQAEELKGAFAVHLKETEGQVKRLEQVFQLLGEKPAGVECKAIQGIIEEGQEVLQEFSGGEALDAGLIAAAQAVEHYEITRYGTLLAWAKQLGLTEAEGLIQETLIEEENTDQILSVGRGCHQSCRRLGGNADGRMATTLPGSVAALKLPLPGLLGDGIDRGSW
jgi:ferritin-like metal-binding protein YciE